MATNRKIISVINTLIFTLIFASRSLTDAIYVTRDISSPLINLKYFFLIFGMLFCALQLIKKKKLIYVKEIKSVYIIIVLFFVISLLMMFINRGSNNKLLEELFKLFLPITYVFLILNTFDFEDIYKSMVLAFAFSMLGYILEIGFSTFSYSNILSVDFSNSYSPFESSAAAGASVAFFTFFMYFRKNKVLKYLSFIFPLFTFKRFSVLFALLLFFLPMVVNMDRMVTKNQKMFLKIMFIILTVVYYLLLMPSSSTLFYKIFNETQRKFTMGRSEFLSWILNGNFTNLGLGSTTKFLGKSLEMDLIKILIETGFLGLIIFVFNYWNCSGQIIYTNTLMGFQFFNLLTSHSLSNSFNWILTFLVIGCITYKQVESEKFLNKVKPKKRKIHIKF